MSSRRGQAAPFSCGDHNGKRGGTRSASSRMQIPAPCPRRPPTADACAPNGLRHGYAMRRCPRRVIASRFIAGFSPRERARRSHGPLARPVRRLQRLRLLMASLIVRSRPGGRAITQRELPLPAGLICDQPTSGIPQRLNRRCGMPLRHTHIGPRQSTALLRTGRMANVSTKTLHRIIDPRLIRPRATAIILERRPALRATFAAIAISLHHDTRRSSATVPCRHHASKSFASSGSLGLTCHWPSGPQNSRREPTSRDGTSAKAPKARRLSA